MSTLKVDDIVNSAGTGPVNFSKGFNATYGSEVRAAQGTNFVLTTADAHLQLVTPTASITCTLPGDAKAGEVFTIRNLAAASTGFTIQILADDASLIRTVYPSGGPGDVVALQGNPATQAQWEGISVVTSQVSTYTATYTSATPPTTAPTATLYWARSGDFVSVWGRMLLSSLVVGSGTGATYLTLPFSAVPDFSKSATFASVGVIHWYDADGSPRMFAANPYIASGLNGIRLLDRSANATVNWAAYGASDELYINCTVPIQGWTTTKG